MYTEAVSSFLNFSTIVVVILIVLLLCFAPLVSQLCHQNLALLSTVILINNHTCFKVKGVELTVKTGHALKISDGYSKLLNCARAARHSREQSKTWTYAREFVRKMPWIL